MPATDWREDIATDEVERFERYAALLGDVQKREGKGGAPSRALHAKSNLGVIGELEIANVPEEARVGMFATPKKYPALVRFSNGAGRRQSDRTLDVRGIAVKVLGVDGTKLIPGMEDETTQDFLAIRTSSLPIKSAHEFMTLVRVARPPALLPVRLIGALGFRRGVAIIKGALAGLKAPQSSLAGTSYFSALPSALGPYAVQYAFTARDTPSPMKLASANTLGEDLAARLRTSPVVYDFQLRFYVDAQSTPIEDASIEWKAPWITVGTLTLPVQDPDSPKGTRVSETVEDLSFDPWHSRSDMRPLGNIMRARNVAYRTSTLARNAKPEPREMPAFE
jgi:hypothetical protein